MISNKILLAFVLVMLAGLALVQSSLMIILLLLGSVLLVRQLNQNP